MAEVKRLMSAARLVTVTGPGGCGKTRLSVRVAGDLRRMFADGVWQVDLAPVADGAVVPYAVIEVLGISSTADVPPARLLAEYLAGRKLLLLMDNCEHLLDACAALVVPLLQAAAGLRVLCTSRQSLGVVGESVFTVPPLPAPGPGAAPVMAIDSFAAVQLFLERAVAAASGFTLTGDNRRSVAEICGRLDGLPLSIELAAAQVRSRSVEEVAAGLVDRFKVFSVRHATPRHHRGVRETFDWSFTLCTPAERALWARVAVFAGSFDLAAATAVCADADVPARDVSLLLAGLVDKSIVIREDWSGGSRFRLLETVREYGLLQLHDVGDEVEARLYGRLRDWFLNLTARMDVEWFGPDQERWLTQLRVEYANLRAVLGWCLDTPGQERAGLRIAADLWHLWYVGGAVHEGRYWLERALRADPQPSLARLAALSAYCKLLRVHADQAAAERVARESLALARQLDAPVFVARAVGDLGISLLLGGDVPAARPMLEAAVASLTALGGVETEVVMAQLGLAMATLLQGDPARAAALCAQVLADCRARGERHNLGYTLIAAALAALAVDDVPRADGYVRESLRLREDLGDMLGMAGSVERLAWIAGLSSDMPRATRLLGAADRLWRVVDRPLWGSPQWLSGREQCQTSARRVLGDEAFEAALRAGAELSLAEAVGYALNETRQPPRAPPVDRAAAAPLTRRESQIADLVAQGLSNKQIAAGLVISQRTAEGHVENILRKLGLTSRTQLATWVVQRPDRPTR